MVSHRRGDASDGSVPFSKLFCFRCRAHSRKEYPPRPQRSRSALVGDMQEPRSRPQRRTMAWTHVYRRREWHHLNAEAGSLHVTCAVMRFASLQSENGTEDERAFRKVRKTDESFDKACNCLRVPYVALFQPRGTDPTEEQVNEILCTHKCQIAELERNKVEADCMQDVNVSCLQHGTDRDTHKLIEQLRFDVPRAEPVLLSPALDLPNRS